MVKYIRKSIGITVNESRFTVFRCFKSMVKKYGGKKVMCTRLKKIRKTIKLTQAQFAESLGLGQSTYAMMEVGKRDILDRHVKTICALYNVNEEWFRTGEGEMFQTPYNSFVQELSAKYNVDETMKYLITAYLELDTHERATVTAFIAKISDMTAGYVIKKGRLKPAESVEEDK